MLRTEPPSPSNGSAQGTLLEQLAAAKALPFGFLASLGIKMLADGRIGIPYRDATGAEIAVKTRSSLDRSSYRWTPSLSLATYGDWRLDQAARQGFLILVEGESDCWACWRHNFPALGVPGANTVHTLQSEHLDSVERVLIHQEPDSGGEKFVQGCMKRLGHLGFQGRRPPG